MKYRFAESKDRAAIQQMAHHFATEAAAAGSPQAPESCVADFMRLYDSYRRGSLFGLAILAEGEDGPLGLTLCGETWEDRAKGSELGRVAYIWMVWVHPAHRKSRVALEMLRFGEPALIEDGFISAVTNVRVDNPAGARLAESFGCTPLETVYLFSFKEHN